MWLSFDLRPRSLRGIQTYYQAAGHIKVKFHVEPLWSRETKICSKDIGYMAKMVAIPVYGYILNSFFPGTKKPK